MSLNSAPLIFKRAISEDASILVDLENRVAEPKTYGQPLDFDGAVREINNNAFYFIKSDGVIVGTAAYLQRPDKSVYLSNIALDPTYRNRGIGRKTMLFLLTENSDANRIDLVTHPENQAALRLYMSFGFEVESRKENYFGDGEPRLVLVKRSTLDSEHDVKKNGTDSSVPFTA